MKRTAYLTIMVLAALSLLLAACAQPSATLAPLRVATDATWPPFETVDEETKEVVGFDIELLDAIAEKEGLDIEYVNVGFDPLLAGISGCQYDIAISSITITEARAETMAFSEPYIEAGQIVTVRIDEEAIQSKDDLSGKTVGAQLGTTGAMEAEAIEGVTVKTYDSVDLAFLDLINSQIDAVIADNPTALNFALKNEGKLKTVGEVFTDEYYGIAVCKNNPELLAKINSGLAAVKADGLIDDLRAKWLDVASAE